MTRFPDAFLYAGLGVSAFLVAVVAYLLVDPSVLTRRRIRARAEARKGWFL